VGVRLEDTGAPGDVYYVRVRQVNDQLYVLYRKLNKLSANTQYKTAGFRLRFSTIVPWNTSTRYQRPIP
jgi:hypothetical protein